MGKTKAEREQEEEWSREMQEQFARWEATPAGRLERYAWAFQDVLKSHIQDVRLTLDELYHLRADREEPRQLVVKKDAEQIDFVVVPNE